VQDVVVDSVDCGEKSGFVGGLGGVDDHGRPNDLGER